MGPGSTLRNLWLATGFLRSSFSLRIICALLSAPEPLQRPPEVLSRSRPGVAVTMSTPALQLKDVGCRVWGLFRVWLLHLISALRLRVQPIYLQTGRRDTAIASRLQLRIGKERWG